MPTIKMNAQKMTQADVQFISLVERGANRIPFKVIKQEKEMSKAFAGLDLGAFFARKQEKVEPTIVGIAIMKDEGYESIKKQLAEAGFTVEDETEMADGSVVFKQAEATGEETVIRMNDHVALITKGFSPYNMDLGGDTTFADVAAARGFYPGISSVMSTLTEMVDTTVRKAESPADAQRMVAQVFKEAGAYINSFLSGLPSKAFKLETIVPDVAVTTKGEGEGGGEGEGVDTGTETTPAVQKGEGESPAEGGGATHTEKQDEIVEKPLTEQEVAAIVQTTVEEKTNAVVEKMDKLAEVLAGLSNSMTSIQSSVDTFGARIEAVESVAKAAKEAVTGTVVAGVQGSDGTQVTKRDREYVGKEIDTAFMPRRQAHRR